MPRPQQPQPVTVEMLNGAGSMLPIDRLPDQCPQCHHHLQPKIVSFQAHDDFEMVEGVFRCTNNRCQRVFIGTYEKNNNAKAFSLNKLLPYEAVPLHIPGAVASLSPMFVEISKQVTAADAHNLDQLVGVGLRKALEFLIKDYAISRDKSKEGDIKKRFVADVIKDYIDDNTVKALAERAIWLGNDETHYERRWTTKDITDLKALVHLTMNAIENKIEGEKHIAAMPHPGKKP